MQLLVSGCFNIGMLWCAIIGLLLTCCGDIERNPGPGSETKHGSYLTFCHANTMYEKYQKMSG